MLSLDTLYALQKNKWTYQHQVRARESREIANIPNAFAVTCADFLPDRATVLEFGAANGRDARYWGRKIGACVLALDIAPNACEDNRIASRLDGTSTLVTPIQIGGLVQDLPLGGREVIDGFYARSALHLADEDIAKLFTKVTRMLKPNGLIMIEGKACDDNDILSSESIEGEPYLYYKVDAYGYPHLRRAWDEASIHHYCEVYGWELISCDRQIDDRMGKESAFINFIARKR